jgi:hypothetical protein
MTFVCARTHRDSLYGHSNCYVTPQYQSFLPDCSSPHGILLLDAPLDVVHHSSLMSNLEMGHRYATGKANVCHAACRHRTVSCLSVTVEAMTAAVGLVI